MPVTAKFSEEFYEKLGHGIVDEFVDWFNHMDLAYKTELRELNEVNFQRFEAVLRGEIAGAEARLERKIDADVGQLKVEISALRTEFKSEMAAMKTEIIKWMFLFWSGTALTVIGVMVALTR